MQHQVDDVHLGINLLLHVIVLVVDIGCECAFTIFLVHLLDKGQHQTFALLELRAVVVADDIRQFGLFATTLHTRQVIEALIALGGLWTLVGRQQSHEFGSQQRCVHHLTLGIAWVYAHALDGDLCRGSVEVLELQLTHVATIHRVGPLAAKLLYIEVVGTHAYLLVGVEGYTYLSVLHFRMLLQPHHCLYNLCDAGLVVSTQQGGAVCDNEVLTHMSQQLRELLRTQDHTLRQLDVATLVVLHDTRLDVSTRAIGTGVVVGYETDRGRMAFHI